ncbi:TPA: helix-turn-helix domain-containing protein [Mannheimia haemolytica]
MDKSILLAFGYKVKKLRLEKELSQEELAFLSGLDRTYISGIENGKRNVSLKALYAIALALDMNLSTLFKDVEVDNG